MLALPLPTPIQREQLPWSCRARLAESERISEDRPMRKPLCLLALFMPILGCSKDSKNIESFRYTLYTEKGAVFPEGVDVLLGGEKIASLGAMHEGLMQHKTALEFPISAPLSGRIEQGFTLRWQSPCGESISELTTDKDSASLAKHLKGKEKGQKKHGHGPADGSINLSQKEATNWSTKPTLFWVDGDSDSELQVGEMKLVASENEPVTVHDLGCAKTHTVKFAGAEATLDVEALVKSLRFDVHWEHWDDTFARYAFMGKKGTCYALRELNYSSDNVGGAPKTTVLKGGELHLLPDRIHYYFEDAPEALEVSLEAGESAADKYRIKQELKKTDCP